MALSVLVSRLISRTQEITCGTRFCKPTIKQTDRQFPFCPLPASKSGVGLRDRTMAIAQLPGERVRAYGSVSPAGGSRGNGRRAVAAAAVATLLLVGAVMMSGGGGGGRADVLSMESEELGSADAMKKRMGILMGRFSMLDVNGTAAADAAAASKAAAEGAEAAAAAGDAPQAAAPAKCSGNPMETYESFSCWLAQYKDPEDVEDYVKAHSLFDSQKWYADKKNFSIDTERWYQVHKGFGGFSRAKWLADHNLKNEGTAVPVAREMAVRRARVQVLSAVKSLLDGNESEPVEESGTAQGGLYGNKHCGLDCWLAQFADPEDIEGPGGWYEQHKHMAGVPDIEGPGGWYEQHKNMTGVPDTEKWYKEQAPDFDFEAWYRAHYNIANFSWPDWLQNHGLRRTEMVRDFRTAILVSSILDASGTAQGGLYGSKDCGLECWLAKYPDPENIEGPGGWYEMHKNVTGGLDTEAWYAMHKNLSGGLDDTESWYAKQPTFDFEKWYREHYNINNFSWPDWYRSHNMRPTMFSREIHTALKADAAHLLALRSVSSLQQTGDNQLGVDLGNSGDLESWIDAQSHFNLQEWLHSQPSADVQRWMDSVSSGNSTDVDAFLAAHRNTEVSRWMQQFTPFNLQAWLHAQDRFSLSDWLHQVRAAQANGSTTMEAWLDSQRKFDLSSWLHDKDKSFDLSAWLNESTAGKQSMDEWMAANGGHFDMNAWLHAKRAFSLEAWMSGAENSTHSLDVDSWLKEQPAFNMSGWMDEQEGRFNVGSWLKTHKAFSLAQWLAQQKNTSSGRFNLNEWLDSSKRHFSLKQWLVAQQNSTDFDLSSWLDSKHDYDIKAWLKEQANTTVGRFKLEDFLKRTGTKYDLAGWLDNQTDPWEWADKQPDFNLSGWLDTKPDPQTWANMQASFPLTQWLAEHPNPQDWANNQSDFDLSGWLDSHPNFDLKAYLAANPGPDLPADNSSSTPFSLSEWLDQHENFPLSRWLKNQSGYDMHSFLDNSGTDGKWDKSRLNNFSLSKWLDSYHNMNTTAWMEQVESEAPTVGGSNWKKLAPSASAYTQTGPGFCCCGFACEKASNECCGPYMEEGYRAGQWYPEASQAQVKAVLSTVHKADARTVKLAMSRLQLADAPAAAVAAANGAAAAADGADAAWTGASAWSCDESVGGFPVRVGDSCNIECASSDGVNCAEEAGVSCEDAATAAGNASAGKNVVCGPSLVKAWGTDGYSEASHWCAKAKQVLGGQMAACSSSGPGKGSAFGSGLKFAAGVSFSGGDSFGNDNRFGKGDTFGPHTVFGSGNQFASGGKFGAFARFNDSNKLGSRESFGAGAAFSGDGNVIGKEAFFGAGAAFKGTGTKIGRGSVIGDGAVIGGGAVVGKDAALGKGVRLEGGSTIGSGAQFGVDVGAESLGKGEGEEPPVVSTGIPLKNGTSYYRPDPGSDFAREGDARIDFRMDGRDHFPVYYDDGAPGDVEVEGHAGDVVSVEGGAGSVSERAVSRQQALSAAVGAHRTAAGIMGLVKRHKAAARKMAVTKKQSVTSPSERASAAVAPRKAVSKVAAVKRAASAGEEAAHANKAVPGAVFDNAAAKRFEASMVKKASKLAADKVASKPAVEKAAAVKVPVESPAMSIPGATYRK